MGLLKVSSKSYPDSLPTGLHWVEQAILKLLASPPAALLGTSVVPDPKVDHLLRIWEAPARPSSDLRDKRPP